MNLVDEFRNGSICIYIKSDQSYILPELQEILPDITFSNGAYVYSKYMLDILELESIYLYTRMLNPIKKPFLEFAFPSGAPLRTKTPINVLDFLEKCKKTIIINDDEFIDMFKG